mmetsp:Transcript_2282/g.3631  ORF Transcript_2282/g.3631 Transcript_2282/m.3631 type:complete len:92 (-) Transcript_2282:29-304(-)
MSYFGSFPKYKIAPFRGVGEIVLQAMRTSMKIDMIGVPMLLPPAIFIWWMSKTEFFGKKEHPNPYTQAVIQKKQEGAYDGSKIAIRPHRYA